MAQFNRHLIFVFALAGYSIAQVKRYTTSETKNLSNEGIIDLTDNSFTVTLEGKSITTIVSTETNPKEKPSDSSVPQSYRLEQNYPIRAIQPQLSYLVYHQNRCPVKGI